MAACTPPRMWYTPTTTTADIKFHAQCFAEEFEHLNANLRQAITEQDPETMGEYLDSLRSFGLTLRDPLVRTGFEYLLSAQNDDGSWGDTKDPDPYGRYHPTWTAIDGLRDYRWTRVLPCPVLEGEGGEKRFQEPPHNPTKLTPTTTAATILLRCFFLLLAALFLTGLLVFSFFGVSCPKVTAAAAPKRLRASNTVKIFFMGFSFRYNEQIRSLLAILNGSCRERPLLA